MKKLFVLVFFLLLPLHAQAQFLGNPIVAVRSTATESSHVLKSSNGSMYGFSATTGASAGYIMLIDSATIPSDGAVTPVQCYSVAANTSAGASWGTYPVPYQNGIVIVFSTTGCFTKTASSTAFFSAQVQ